VSERLDRLVVRRDRRKPETVEVER